MGRRDAPATGADDWAAFQQWGSALGIALDTRVCEQLAVYRTLLLAWSRRMNLTAVREPRAILIKHFLDSLTVLRHIPPDAPLLDIGSGAGFPGLVIKVVRPAQPVTLAEARGKRVGFLEEVRRSLGIKGCEILHRHVTAHERDLEGRFGVVVSRAVQAWPAFLALARPCLRPGGRVIGMWGREAPPEAEALRAAGAPWGAVLLARERLHLPEGGGTRHLVVMERLAASRST
jgi:16S rRNA (guanine527-N7)-methyltransferase